MAAQALSALAAARPFADDHPGMSAALALIAKPRRFLSIVQIGITLVGILAGTSHSAASSADRLTCAVPVRHHGRRDRPYFAKRIMWAVLALEAP